MSTRWHTSSNLGEFVMLLNAQLEVIAHPK